jgi:hypothetical protein
VILSGSFLVDTAIPKVSAQIQCALYEKIYDAVNDIIDLECTYVRQSPEFQLPMYLKMRTQTLFHFVIEFVNLCFHFVIGSY